MATLTYNDLLKRDNLSRFITRIQNKGSFREKSDGGSILECTGSIRTNKGDMELVEDVLAYFIKNKSGSEAIEVEVVKNGSKRWERVSKFYKDSEFGGVAGKSSGGGSERQELGLISVLNDAALRGDDYFVASLGRNIKIKESSKNEGLSSMRQEPYIDVFIEDQRGKTYGVSCKGEAAPSLAGGGIVGMQVVVPDLLDRLYKSIIKYLKGLGHKEGAVVDASSIPDLFIRIPDSYVKKILIGNKAMGGPVDLMYIGPMDVVGDINDRTNEIKLNGGRGKFYTIEEYMRKIPNFYFRIRKRDLPKDNMIQITYKEKNKSGYPIIFKGFGSKKNHFRLVVTDKASTTGKKLSL